jgi:Uma2 family endonuclease
VSLPDDLRPSVEEFAAWEAEQEASHEYVDGDIVLMSGASETHELISGLLAEVLSPSTKSIDLAEKLAEYGQLRAIKEYLVIDPEARRAMLYQRHDLRWLLLDDPRADGVTFAGVRIDLDEIFDYVERTRTT